MKHPLLARRKAHPQRLKNQNRTSTSVSVTISREIQLNFEYSRADCDECAAWVVGSCVLHERTIIEALPLGEEEQDPPLAEGLRYNQEKTAVFATQDFPKGTLFGPVEVSTLTVATYYQNAFLSRATLSNASRVPR